MGALAPRGAGDAVAGGGSGRIGSARAGADVGVGGAAAHVVVEDLTSPVLAADDAHHLGAVLRLRVGESVGLTDGKGGYIRGRWAGGGAVETVGAATFSPRPQPVLTIGFVPVKGDRPEWVVQKLTELGVDRIVVVRSERAVVRWDGARATNQLERLAKVARAAVMQSRRVWLPEIVGVVPLLPLVRGEVGWGGAGGEDAGGSPGSGRPGGAGGRVGIADIGGQPLEADLTSVVVGPEGGWSDAERRAGVDAGAALVGLGTGVLRAETAALAAGVLLTAVRDGSVQPPGPRPR